MDTLFSFSMADLIIPLGLLGNITTGLVYLAPIKTFWRIVVNKSTEEFESMPYVCKLLNAYFWVYYGILKPNSILVATVNGFGAVCEIIFVILFLLFAPPRMRFITAILAGVLDVGFPAAVVVIAQSFLKREAQIDVAGFFCVCFSLAAYGSPLSAMKTVITTKSVEYMPFLLSFSLFINGGVWTFYAIITKDWFIGLPNGTGFGLGTAQMILYAMYYKRPHQPHKTSENLEANESLISESDRNAPKV
ncbi:bidirectional sugar transporter SWEET16-like isoform X1 [Mercurialis annua]|uniref:bidirectional sugar transporter SWEET16-like isoform X1 n=1 Tax=Mercurialis annua TaxID=3986 RepID=UPI00215F4E46|nr:bidirectional sugar transporter SWEET16-like isoform X1 [Mercurialis annua]